MQEALNKLHVSGHGRDDAKSSMDWKVVGS